VELHSPVAIATPDGRLNRAAVGWSRRPLQTCRIAARRWPRRKRWHHWGVASDTQLVTLTFADLDYLGIAAVYVLDYASGRSWERVAARPLGWGRALPDEVGAGEVAVEAFGLAFGFAESPAGTRLTARARGLAVDLEIARPPGHETLNVLVPWSDDLFQLTSKQPALPARGTVVAGGRRFAFGPENHAFACLDFGRGVWPWRTAWNWASASGVQGGRVVGLTLGGRWTDGTGQNENAVVIDGRLTKLADVAFRLDAADLRRPWTIRGADVELAFAPFADKRVSVELGVVGAALKLCFGRFSGRLAGVEVRDLIGWAEELRARW
jgi:hypothetical protein